MTVENGRAIRDFKSVPSHVEDYVAIVFSYRNVLDLLDIYEDADFYSPYVIFCFISYDILGSLLVFNQPGIGITRLNSVAGHTSRFL